MKAFLFTLSIFVVVNLSVAQNQQFSGSYDKITTPSPTASSFGIFGSKDLNYYTGTLPVEVKLFSLKESDIEINVSLNGSARAIKAGEIPSWVGSGWNLNAGGVISRNTIGTPDDLQVGPTTIGFLHRLPDVNLFKNAVSYNNPNATNYSVIDNFIFNGLDEYEIIDLQPDEFNFNFMGYSGSFYFDYNGQPQCKSHQNIKIEHTINPVGHSIGSVYLYNFIQSFKITTGNGFQYTFSALEVTKQSFGLPGGNINGETDFVSSWYLTEILSPNGITANFHYTDINSNVWRKIYSFFDKSWKYLCFTNFSNWNQTFGTGLNAGSPSSYHIYPIYLQSITLGNSALNFTTSDRNDIKNHTYSPPYFNNVTIHKEKKLEKVELVDVTNNIIIDRYSFSYLDVSTTRLRLNSLTQQGRNPYIFEYNGNLDVNYTTRSIDHWGYYNASSNLNTLIPPTQIDFSPYLGGIQTIGNANRNPNFNATLLGSLKKIIYPTGGFSEFEYEANDYKTIGGNTFNGTKKITGGLRLQSIKEFDGVSTQPVKIKKFKYLVDLNDANSSSGIISNEPTYSIKIYAPASGSISGDVQGIVMLQGNSIFPISYSQGSHVVYNKVTLIEENNGRSEFYFTSFLDNPDFNPVYSFPVNMTNFSTNEILRFSPATCNENRRGLLTKKIDYNQIGNKLSETNFEYRVEGLNSATSQDGANTYDDVFFSITRIPASFTNVIYSGSLGLVPSAGSPSGVWFLNNTGYKIKKDWITKSKEQIITYDPQTGSTLDVSNTFFYDNPVHAQLTRTITTNSKGENIVTINRYPGDESLLSSPVLDNATINTINHLKNTFQYDKLLEQITQKNSQNISRNRFSYINNSGNVHKVSKEVGNNGLQEELVYKYDNKGNITNITKKGSQTLSYIWGYNNQYVVGSISNANTNEVFHDNFEENLGWNFPSVSFDKSKQFTGNKSLKIFNPSSTKLLIQSNNWLNINLQAPRKFKYSGWVYSDGPQAELVFLMKYNKNSPQSFDLIHSVTTNIINKWTYIEGVYQVPTGITALGLRLDNNGGGNIWFDDLRLHPDNAEMTTFTYSPLVGLTSQVDLNNKPTYFDYDNFNRLDLVRNKDRQIIKKYCYNYTGQVVDCLKYFYNDAMCQSFAPVCPPLYTSNGNYNFCIPSGMFSSTLSKEHANQLAQNYVNTNGQAIANSSCFPMCSIEACTNNYTEIDKKCINGVCETGIKVYTSCEYYSPGEVICEFHYEFSDGSWSATSSHLSGNCCY